MPETLQDLWSFGAAVLRQWIACTGSFVAIALDVVQRLRGKEFLTRRHYLWLFAGLFGFVALFLAWQEQYLEVRRLREPPTVRIEHYDKIMHPDQDWTLIVKDGRKPDFKATVLLLRGGRLHVKMQNEEGNDRSAEARGVRILGPCLPPEPSP